MSPDLLKIALVKSYPEFHLQVEMSLKAGEFFTLLGPSGCGKTTLLRLIAGLESPDAGSSLEMNGMELLTLNPAKRGIGMVFQDYALFPHLTVAENIGYALKVQKIPIPKRRQRVEEIMDLLELTGFEKRDVNLLSGGERQRVALARALVAEPSVLLMDEPFAALDHSLRQRLRRELHSLQRRLGLTVVFVTHQQEEALELADRLAVMEKGRVEQIGTPREVYEYPKSLFVAQFLGDANLLPCRVFHTGGGLCCTLRGSITFPLPGFSLTPGDYWMMIRPEDLRIAPEIEPGCEVKVANIHYLGYAVVIEGEITGEAGSLLKIFTDKQNAGLKQGDVLRVGWEMGRVRFLSKC